MIPTELYTQIDRDSAAIGVLDSIAHRVTEKPGRYELHAVARGTSRVIPILVDDAGADSVVVDLSGSERDSDCGCPGTTPATTVKPGGLLALAVRSGAGRYHAELHAADGETLLDTRKLPAGDQVGIGLVRPGTYRLRAGGESTVVVSYPVRGAGQLGRQDPVVVTASGADLKPGSVTVAPAQSIVVELADGGRVTLELIEPDDGPKREPRPPKPGRVITVRSVPRKRDGRSAS